VRPAQERDRKTLGPRTAGAARHGDDGLSLIMSVRCGPRFAVIGFRVSMTRA
jgi:hypothetical protein